MHALSVSIFSCPPIGRSVCLSVRPLSAVYLLGKANQVIYLTDNTFSTPTTFPTTECVYQYKPASPVAAGTVVRAPLAASSYTSEFQFVNPCPGTRGLNNNGDQVYIYVGSSSTSVTQLLTCVYADTGGATAFANAGLTNGVDALLFFSNTRLGKLKSGFTRCGTYACLYVRMDACRGSSAYVCICGWTGTRASLLASLNNAANYDQYTALTTENPDTTPFDIYTTDGCC